MPPISLHEWNYGATELESKLTYLLERDKELLGMAVQRSVVFTTAEKKRELALVRIDVLHKED